MIDRRQITVSLLMALAMVAGAWARDVAPVNNKLYMDECGACHFAYPPGLLPSRSWRELMKGLDDHFGENAELDAGDVKALREYLMDNAGDASLLGRSNKLLRSIKRDDTPLRITGIPYFVREHNEMPHRMRQGNAEVKSLSRCDVCHRQAAKGSFAEREIDIPGFGSWKD